MMGCWWPFQPRPLRRIHAPSPVQTGFGSGNFGEGKTSAFRFTGTVRVQRDRTGWAGFQIAFRIIVKASSILALGAS
jgi:hypothetical protein